MSGPDGWTADPAGKVYLHPDHLRELAVESTIADDVISERRYQTIPRSSSGEQQLRGCKIPRWAREPKTQRLPGLLIPVYRPTGELTSWRFKPWKPAVGSNGRSRRYAAPAGRTSVVDVHPRNRDRIADPSVELWITEGHKKADALTSQGVCVAAVDGVFNWRTRHGALGDWEDVPLKGRRVVVCFDADARDNRNVANAMARLGKWLDSKGARKVWYLVVPAEVNGTAVKGVDDYLAAGGTLDQLRSAMEPRPPDPRTIGDAFTDARLAETIASDVLADRICWTKGLGWLEWNGARWREVPDKVPTEAVRIHVLAQLAQAIEEQNTSASQGWFQITGAGRMRSVLGLAAGIDTVIRDAGEFDQQPDLLNTPNGVIDLQTGDLLPADPDLLFTRSASVAYHPDATHPDWDAALTAIPGAVREWLQIRFGQAITGHIPPDDKLVIQQGGGENGKTTIAAGIAGALGDYYLLVSDRVILANPSDHPTELMDLRGTRFAMIEETPEARRLNIQRLKKTVGTPQITARHIRKDSVTFDVTHSLFLSSNYKPIVEETDHGTWRRLALVRYPYTFRNGVEPAPDSLERQGDPTLRDRIKAGLDGQHEAVLAWLVAGAVKWYAGGRVMPAPPGRVARDTRVWRQESDLVLAYIDDRIIFDDTRHVMSTDLLADVNKWLKAHGHQTWSDKLLGSRFGGHDELARHHVTRRRRRKTDPPPDPKDLEPGETIIDRPPWDSVFESRPVEPNQYRAWVGLRFRTDDDDVDPDDDTGNEAQDAAEEPEEPAAEGPEPEVAESDSGASADDPVTLVTGVPDNQLPRRPLGSSEHPSQASQSPADQQNTGPATPDETVDQRHHGPSPNSPHGPSPNGTVTVGSRVTHPHFGAGRIVDVDASNDYPVVEIKFDAGAGGTFTLTGHSKIQLEQPPPAAQPDFARSRQAGRCVDCQGMTHVLDRAGLYLCPSCQGYEYMP